VQCSSRLVTKLESTVRYLAIEVDDALQLAEQTEQLRAMNSFRHRQARHAGCHMAARAKMNAYHDGEAP
jgi:hypothetical protein